MRPKESLSFQRGGEFAWDRADAFKAVVLCDEQVASDTCMRHLRRVTWQNPEAGESWQFAANEYTLLVLLCVKRRGIEKVFDETKTKLEERRPWASSEPARSMQGQFLCLAHKLSCVNFIRSCDLIPGHRRTMAAASPRSIDESGGSMVQSVGRGVGDEA